MFSKGSITRGSQWSYSPCKILSNSHFNDASLCLRGDYVDTDYYINRSVFATVFSFSPGPLKEFSEIFFWRLVAVFSRYQPDWYDV